MPDRASRFPASKRKRLPDTIPKRTTLLPCPLPESVPPAGALAALPDNPDRNRSWSKTPILSERLFVYE
jgi:hypothetical protein